MEKAKVSAVSIALLLLSQLGATQLASLYLAVVVIPFTALRHSNLAETTALAVTIAVTWQPFDTASAFVGALLSGAAIA